MGWPTHKPARGGPASGVPASGIPAGGDGWGGAARGSGNGNARRDITQETAAEIAAMVGTPEAEAKRERRIASREEVLERMSHIALNSENEFAAIKAGEALLDRTEGKPVQKTELTGAGGGPLSIEDARERIADRIARVAGRGAAGGGAGGTVRG